MQSYHFTIKHKSGKLNQGADALSRRYLLLFQLDAYLLSFEHLKALYDKDEDLRSYMLIIPSTLMETF